MGKSNKRFVPPVKSAENSTIKSVENGPTIIARKSNPNARKKTLLVNFDYAKIKARFSSARKQKTTKNGNHLNNPAKCDKTSDQRKSDVNNNTPDGSGDHRHGDVGADEFMWFEPVQGDGNQPAASHHHNLHRAEEGTRKALTPKSPPQQQARPRDDSGDVDVYRFPSSPIGPTDDAHDGSSSSSVKKKGKTMKKEKKIQKEKKKKTSNGHVKKSVKKQVLKSLFKMQEDLGLLREKEQALQGSR